MSNEISDSEAASDSEAELGSEINTESENSPAITTRSANSDITIWGVDKYKGLYSQQRLNNSINAALKASGGTVYVDPATGSVNAKVTDISLPGVNGFDLNITRTYNSLRATNDEPCIYAGFGMETLPMDGLTVEKKVQKEYADGSIDEKTTTVSLSWLFFEYKDVRSQKWLAENEDKYEYYYGISYVPESGLAYLNDLEHTTFAGEFDTSYIINTEYEIETVLVDEQGREYVYKVNYDNPRIEGPQSWDSPYSLLLFEDIYTRPENENSINPGIGWEFDIPYIEIPESDGEDGTESDEETYEYLHFGNRGIWLIDFEKGINNLDGYELNDIKIVEDTSVTHDGKTSAYRVDEKNGTKHYFDADGKLMFQEDRFGNRISYYHGSSTTNYILKIVDTVGRSIEFTKETDTTDNTKKYLYITITATGDETDTKVYTYEINDGELICVTDPEEYKYTYEYEKKYGYASLLFREGNENILSRTITTNNDYGGMEYTLLKSTTDYTGATNTFQYDEFEKNNTIMGSICFYKAYEHIENSANKKTYLYDIGGVGEYDGYSDYASTDLIPEDFVYEVKVTEESIAEGKTSYDTYKYAYVGLENTPEMVLVQHSDIGTDHKVITDYTYDEETHLVSEVSTTNYSPTNNANQMTTYVTYVYNNYGDLIMEMPNYDPDRSVTYEYDDDSDIENIYHFPLAKEYSIDGITMIREEYTLTSNGKNIEWVKLYEDNVLKAQTRYFYDNYGNISRKYNYIDSENFIETEYIYKDHAYIYLTQTFGAAIPVGEIDYLVTQADYDAWGNLLWICNENEMFTDYEYNASNQVVKIINPDGTQRTYTYGTEHNNRYVTECDELGNRIKTKYLYGDKPEYIFYENVGLYNKRFYYDAFGNLITEILYSDDLDEENNQLIQSRTEYTYDTAHRPTSKKVYDRNNTLLYHEMYAYGVASETVTVVGDIGTPDVTTVTTYDEFGNVTSVSLGDSVETYTYDYLGNVTEIQSPNANADNLWDRRYFVYDSRGNLLTEVDELGYIVWSEYDWLGNKTRVYDQNGTIAEYIYDCLGRLAEQRVPFEEKDGTVYYSVKKFWCDEVGNVIKEQVVTNAPGEAETVSEVEYTYDSMDRPIMIESNDGTVSNYVQYYYDAKDNVLRTYTGLTSPLTITGLDNVTPGADTTYAVEKKTYDIFGRLLSTTDALNQTESHTYDNANGLLMSTTDRNGQTFVFTYDGMGNMTSKSLADGTNVERIIYDSQGRESSKGNSTGWIDYMYNEKGQLLAEWDDAIGISKEYYYDANGNMTQAYYIRITDEGADVTYSNYTYDKVNRLTRVSYGRDYYDFTGYSAYNMRRTGESRSIEDLFTVKYDLAELKSEANTNSRTTSPLTFSRSLNDTIQVNYTYDNKGNRISTTVTGGETTTYTYNLANALVSQTTGTKLSESYTYYLNGNIKSKTVNGETTNYVYDGMNRLVRENDTEYTFDDFGNRATMTAGIDETSYTYDLNNRLTSSEKVTLGAIITTEYQYDANGNQIEKTVETDNFINVTESVANFGYNCYNQLIGVTSDGVTASYTYMPDGMRRSKTVNGVTTQFGYENGNVFEELTGNESKRYYRGYEIIKDTDNHFYIHNGQGDVAMLTDNTGTVVASYTFDAYGNQSETNTVYNPFGYRGEYTDAETGLVYLRNRYYDPETGRFINEDPIRDGFNWYMYCSGNPIMFIDPWGLTDQDRYVIGDGVRFRSEPGLGGTVYGQLDKNTVVSYIGNKTAVIDGHQWAEVHYNGTMGWIAADYLGILPAEEDSSSNVIVFNTYKIPTGIPNSSEPLYDNNGNKIGERFFGPDGQATHDRDDTDHGNSKQHPDVPHQHEWGPTGRGPATPVPKEEPSQFTNSPGFWEKAGAIAGGTAIIIFTLIEDIGTYGNGIGNDMQHIQQGIQSIMWGFVH